MSTNKRTYTDAEKAEYWRKKALGTNSGSSNSNNNNRSWNSNSRGSNSGTTQKKRSGAKFTRYANADGVERFLTSGWKLSKQKELLTFKCVSTDKSVESDKGWMGSIAVSILNKSNMQKSFYWGTMEKKTGKVVINELSLVLNPRVKNGGYCGTFIEK